MKIMKSKTLVLICLFITIAVHLTILSKIVFFPYPELFIYPYLVSEGLLPYKQILDQHFPGIMFFPINLFTLGMRSIEVALLLHVGIVFINHVLIFIVARSYFKSSKKGLAANLVYAFWHPFLEGYVLWIDSIIPPILLLSYVFISKTKNDKSNWLAFVSGFLMGVGLVFKQTAILTSILVGIYLIKKRAHNFKSFVLGFVVPPILMGFYFLAIGVFKDFIYWTITFNLTTFAESGRKYPSFTEIVKSFWIFGPAFILVFACIFKNNFNKNLILILMFFLGSMLFAYARFDFVHLQPALPFLSILLVEFLILIPRKFRFFLILFYVFSSLYLQLPFYRWAATKRDFFFGDFEKRLVEKVKHYSQGDDPVFVFGTTPHLYFLADRLPPGRIFVFQFPWFMKVAETKILRGIISDPPKVVIRDRNAQVEGMSLIGYMPKIEAYINRYYEVVEKVDNTEILIKNN
jgi:hypothetical protein